MKCKLEFSFIVPFKDSYTVLFPNILGDFYGVKEKKLPPFLGTAKNHQLCYWWAVFIIHGEKLFHFKRVVVECNYLGNYFEYWSQKIPFRCIRLQNLFWVLLLLKYLRIKIQKQGFNFFIFSKQTNLVDSYFQFLKRL